MNLHSLQVMFLMTYSAVSLFTLNRFLYRIVIFIWISYVPGGTLLLFGWGCAAGTLKPLAYTRASSSEFCFPILD